MGLSGRKTECTYCQYLATKGGCHGKHCISYSNSVCPSHAGIVSKRRHVARCSLHRWIAKCVQFCRNQNIPQGRPLPPEILAQRDLPTPEGCEFWHVLPCSTSTVRDRKRSSITLNKNSAWAFQRAIQQGSTPPVTSSKWGSKCLELSYFGRLRQ